MRGADEEGVECDSFDTAHKTAIQAAADMAADDLKTGASRAFQRIVVSDGRGQDLLAVAVEAILKVERKSG